MKRTLFILGCALAAFCDRLCGRGLATNAAPTTEAPPADLAVGIPAGLSATAIAARKGALIAAGTPAMHAEKFAIDAEQAQAHRDAMAKHKGNATHAATAAERIARAINTAHEVDPTKPGKALSDEELAEREKIVADATAAAEELAQKAQSDREAAEQALAEAKSTLAAVAEEQAKLASASKKGGK